MTEKKHEKEMDALKTDIASLREKMEALAAGVKEFTKTKAAEPHDEREHEESKQGGPGGGHGHDAWTDFLHALDEARAQGEKVVKELADEIERHPLVGSIAAFGLGFIIAKLWYGGSKQ